HAADHLVVVQDEYSLFDAVARSQGERDRLAPGRTVGGEEDVGGDHPIVLLANGLLHAERLFELEGEPFDLILLLSDLIFEVRVVGGEFRRFRGRTEDVTWHVDGPSSQALERAEAGQRGEAGLLGEAGRGQAPGAGE